MKVFMKWKNKCKLPEAFAGVVGILMIIQVVFASVSVYANNHEDTTWGTGPYYYNSGNAYTFTTECRYKEDYSSAYIWYTGGADDELPAVYVEVWGCTAATQSSGSSSNQTWIAPQQYYVQVGQSKYLYNSVKENGYNYAFLIISSGGVYGTAMGLWSPDSV